MAWRNSPVVLLTLCSPPARPGEADTVATTRSPAAPAARRGAPVTVYEMSDFQCPYCRRFALETFPALGRGLRRDRQGPLGVHQLPADQHPSERAAAAAELAVCAAQQNAFWRVHDLLYQYQEIWAPLKEPAAFFLTLADSAKISQAGPAGVRSRACHRGSRGGGCPGCRTLRRQQHAHVLHRGRPSGGAQPLAVFRQVLDSILSGKR